MCRALRTALVVEDDRELSLALTRFCTARGISVSTADTHRRATELLKIGYDLAIVDVKLPDGCGVSLCEELSRKAPKPVIVAISGTASGREGFMLARAGAGEYLEKPFDEDELWAAIERNAGVPLDASLPSLVGKISLKDASRAVRHRMFGEALAQAGSISGAARLLGVSRQAVQQAFDEIEGRSS
jgi:DNA-binding response OmpR family regulator